MARSKPLDRRMLLKYLASIVPALVPAFASSSGALTPLVKTTPIIRAETGESILAQTAARPPGQIPSQTPGQTPDQTAVEKSVHGADASTEGPIDVTKYPALVKLACVGDSITAGSGTSIKFFFSYPSQLQRMLGPKWDVGNFGVSGRTVTNSGDFPYQQTKEFTAALDCNPDVVVIMLGTNDTKPQNWKFKDRFVPDYLDLIGKFKALKSRPRIFICLPVPSFGAGNYGITGTFIEEEQPIIRDIAQAQHVDLIDMHTPFAGHEAFLPDRVHPNNEGAVLMAGTVYRALIGQAFTGVVPITIKALLMRISR